ncbi:stalk domain-containing protein [Paenibacillus sp. FSL F4-0236]|uniref:stalk domain-containing protein n=1 Tax=Paenibacillus sp. FSL F4-0236 TaxID=2954731 RepID=UPI0030FC964B
MKKAIIGLVAGMLIGSAGMAAAATTQTVQAALAKFTFSVDGQKQTIKNDPLVYKGTTYLPVREVAEMTGYGLEYDNTKKSIDLKSKGGNIVSTQTWTPARDINQEYGVSVTIDKTTIVTYGDLTVEFPLSMYDQSTNDERVITNTEKTASLMVRNGSLYFGADTLKVLGISQ